MNNSPYRNILYPISNLMTQSNYPLDYQSYNPQKIVPLTHLPTTIPLLPPNAGIYGGQQSTAPWANIPIIPEMHILITQNLLSAEPPHDATRQMIGTNRLGNNTIQQPYIQSYTPLQSNKYFQNTKQPTYNINTTNYQ